MRSRALLPALAAALLLPGCLSQEDQAWVAIHQRNSKAFYDAGDYVRAADQCRRGLAIDEDNANLRLMLGFALLSQAQRPAIEEAAALFREDAGLFGASDWRVDLGLGMTLTQLARHVAADARDATDAQAKARAAEAVQLRAEARAALERVVAATRGKPGPNGEAGPGSTPADALFNLALLELDDGRTAEFVARAPAAIALLAQQERVYAVQAGQASSEAIRLRTVREREVNAGRGRELAGILAHACWAAGDYPAAAKAMESLATFGELGRADLYTRARIREAIGDDERAVEDYSRFIELSADQVDDTVGRAVSSLTRLRARLAEKRTAAPPGGP